MKKVLIIILSVFILMQSTVVFALPDDIPAFYYDLGYIFFEIRELSEYHEPGSIIEVDITTHTIRRKVLKDGHHAFICTPGGEFVNYHELHEGEPLPSDYVYPELQLESTPAATYESVQVLDTSSVVLNDISGHRAEDNINRFVEQGYMVIRKQSKPQLSTVVRTIGKNTLTMLNEMHPDSTLQCFCPT